jgi:hypothetical protein
MGAWVRGGGRCRIVTASRDETAIGGGNRCARRPGDVRIGPFISFIEPGGSRSSRAHADPERLLDFLLPAPMRLARMSRALLAGLCVALLAGCGGDDSPAGPTVVAPAITQQPLDLTVTEGADAPFGVAVTGSAPLSYQWQRNGVDIPGAEGSGHAEIAVGLADSGATFHVIVSNSAGTVTSRDAMLTVLPQVPVLTVSQQPGDASVVPGATVTFSVAAACSSGTLDIQWQRNDGAGGAFAAISGATGASLAFSAASGDEGAQFRAALDCGGQVPTNSATATLSVAAATGLRVDALPVTGLRVQGNIAGAGPVAANPDGSVTFALSNVVKRLSADMSSVTRLAGSGNSAITDGVGTAASFSDIKGMVSDGQGNVYVSDNSSIRRVAADGTVTTLAGSSSGGNTDGTGAAATFGQPSGLAFGPDGDLYVADRVGQNIRRVTLAGVVTTYAGSTTYQSGYLDGSGGLFNNPVAVAVAANGDVYVADQGNQRIRRIARSGNGPGAVSTVAGNGLTGSGADGSGLAVVMEQPIALALRGNKLTVLQGVGLVRQMDLATNIVSTLAGTYTASPTGSADGLPGKALFKGEGAITALADGRFVVGEGADIRVIAANGDARTVAVTGGGDAFGDDGGVLAQRQFEFASNSLQTLAVDAGGRVVVASSRDVRRIAASGTVSLVAGIYGSIMGMIDGVGSVAQFSSVGSGMAAAPDGSLYVSDAESLRRIDPAGNTTLLAGYRVSFTDYSGNSPFGAVDGDAATARFQNGLKLAVGPDGLLYVADTGNSAIRRVDAAGNTSTWLGAMGQATTVNGPRATARTRAPASLAFAPDGTLYFIDNGDLRKVTPDGATVSLVAGGAWGGMVVDPAGNVYLSAADGLYEMAAGTTTPVRLVAGGVNDLVVLGTSPHLGRTQAMALLAPGQLVLISGYQLLKVTLP